MKNDRRQTPFIVLIPIVLALAGIMLLMMNNTLSGQTNNNVNNSVTNEIKNEVTNTVVDYEKITVEDLDEAVQTAYKKVESAVIGITAKAEMLVGGKVVEADYSMGSGVIYKREAVRNSAGKIETYKYYVITNRHVLTVDEQETEQYKINPYIYMGDQDIEIPANLVGYDSKVDIALLTFEYTKYIDPVDIGDSSKLNKGQLVIAVGNPDGYDYYSSVTFGVVSGPERYVSTDTDGDNTTDFSAEYIQHDVAINPGNSGGGLFTLDGKLVGINTLKLVDSKIDGMGFAIPSNVVMTIVEDYLEKGIEIVRPKLGIMGYEIRALSSAQIESSTDIISIPDIYNGEKAYGLYVGEVVPGSTISQTEITAHDIILAINDVKATRTHIINSKLNSLIDGFKVGETVTITYYDRSSNKVKTVDVILKK